jgi:DNA excision repair protein ERCC-2
MAAAISSSPAFTVSVKTLCAFAAKAGDLDLRFVPAPSAQEGQAGHRMVQARRGPSYDSEIALASQYERLHVRGRADGYDPPRGRVEEIKTFRGDFEAIKANHRALHWAQARTYAWMLCERDALERVEVALVYLDLGTEKEVVLEEACTREGLREHFKRLCGRFLAWAEQEANHRAQLDEALGALNFPHGEFRAGQRDLAESVYRSAVSGRCLLAQAPTGIGKTVATLFPLLKARPAQKLDKIYFLTAKTSGRAIALNALRTLDRERAPLRVLELTAREKACEYPGRACNGEACPLARGFYDRLPAARSEAVQGAWLDRAALRRIALAHEVCPYFLAQELVRWSDVIVGDYNYYFDTSAMLFALAEANRWRVSVLVDEAHNLVERARGMYSATLDQAAFDAMRRSAPPPLKKTLARVARSWKELSTAQTADYSAHASLPSRFIAALEQAISQLTDFVAEHPDAFARETTRFYFDAMHFVRIAERFDSHSIFDITLKAGFRSRTPDAVLCLRNVIPAPHLKPRFARAHSVALFSATLTPAHFYSDTLGLPASSVRVDVASPFAAEQLQVRAIADVSTRYRDREQSVARVVDLIAAQYARAPGNYLSFFSSFDYLGQVAAAFAAQHPSIAVWTQSRAMSEAGQQAFLARFAPDGCGIGFAVLGGSFGEAIDLPGTRLVGAFVVTLGLPQLNPVNQQMKARMHEAFGAGYDYTYLFPGLQKVVQAAGRVIRGPHDRGVLYLIDDRFARPEVRRLLPPWWRVDVMRQRDA